MLEQEVRLYVLETDIYARQAIVSYLSWDRRTRVIGHASTVQEMRDDLEQVPNIRLSAIILDEQLAPEATDLQRMIRALLQLQPGLQVICMAHRLNYEQAMSARNAGASAYLVRESVGIGIASAVAYALQHDFVVTPGVGSVLAEIVDDEIAVLPGRRQYPRLTQRIEQALWLCVVEGLPAELAAMEMGVSTSTVRSYIKEAYRILESSDATSYPLDISPVERAFLRYSALEDFNRQPAA